MADEFKSPSKKPPKRHGDLFLGCFGCGSRTTFKRIANNDVKKKVGQGPGLYWSISKSAASTVPVEATAAAIVATVKTAVESDKSGVKRGFGQRRLERTISVTPGGGPPPEAKQGKSRDDDGQKQRRTETGRKKRMAEPLPPPPDYRLDPIVGLWIVMMTLMVLVSLGQVCAILCTAAWFYILPRLREQSDREIVNKGVVEGEGEDDNFSTEEEYKKKVALEGLLHRNTSYNIK